MCGDSRISALATSFKMFELADLPARLQPCASHWTSLALLLRAILLREQRPSPPKYSLPGGRLSAGILRRRLPPTALRLTECLLRVWPPRFAEAAPAPDQRARWAIRPFTGPL